MTATAVGDRHVTWRGIFNLRDLGGYPAAGGRSTRWQVVYRADGLHRAERAGSDVPALGWRTVLDLRTADERDLGVYSCDGVDVIHLPVLQRTWDFIDEACSEDAVEFLHERYAEMADCGAAAIATAFEVLASAARLPVVFHCSAGKDRTGVLAALVLATLGVDDDVIAADYALSERPVTDLIASLTASRPDPAAQVARQPSAVLACPPEAIRRFLEGLRDRYGSTDAYLQAIGVDAGTRLALREVLLEP